MNPEDIEYLLSVDPGTKSGWALWERATSATWGFIKYGRLDDAEGALVMFEFLGDLLPSWLDAHLVIEGQWYAPPPKRPRPGQTHAPFQAVEKLIESRCRWQDAVDIAGGSSETVAPGKWIRAVSRGAPGDTPAERVHNVCRNVFRLECTEDEAAAIMLGYWWLRGGSQQIDFRLRPRHAE